MSRTTTGSKSSRNTGDCFAGKGKTFFHGKKSFSPPHTPLLFKKSEVWLLPLVATKNNHIHTRASERFTFAEGKLFTLQRNASRRHQPALHIPSPSFFKKSGVLAICLSRYQSPLSALARFRSSSSFFHAFLKSSMSSARTFGSVTSYRAEYTLINHPMSQAVIQRTFFSGIQRSA